MAAEFANGDVPGAALIRAMLNRMAAEGEAAWVDCIMSELVSHCERVATDADAWAVLVHGLSLRALEDGSALAYLQVGVDACEGTANMHAYVVPRGLASCCVCYTGVMAVVGLWSGKHVD